jgi:hypothetical protein
MDTIEVYAYIAKGLSGAPADQFGMYVTGEETDQPRPVATWAKQSYWALSGDGSGGYSPVLIHIYYEGDLPDDHQRDYINGHVKRLTGQLLFNQK